MSRLFLMVLIVAPVLCRRGGGGHHSSGGHFGHTSHTSHTGFGQTSHTGVNSHSYPASNGLSGHGTGSHNTHTAGGAAYPPSNGLSGNNRAPGSTYHKTEVHHHYHYSPPQQIHYGGGHSYPVYQGTPPVYIYQYRDSGSPFNTLLTGLALYNLGKMSAHHSYNDHYHEYRQRDGEVCMFEINKSNGEFQQTRIDCKLMSHFIYEKESQSQQHSAVSKNTSSVTTVTESKTSDNNTTVTTTNTTTVVDALQVKGPPIEVTEGMKCFMIRTLRGYSNIKEKVDCGLLQAYAVNSFRNSALENKPVLVITILLGSLIYFV